MMNLQEIDDALSQAERAWDDLGQLVVRWVREAGRSLDLRFADGAVVVKLDELPLLADVLARHCGGGTSWGFVGKLSVTVVGSTLRLRCLPIVLDTDEAQDVYRTVGGAVFEKFVRWGFVSTSVESVYLQALQLGYVD